MPPAYEVLLLNTAIPQIQAAQSGDTYVVPRDIAFSTVASFAAGAEATPSIVATGDTNTGIWFPAADTVAISTGGTSRLRLDSSGNLGLGVTPSLWGTLVPAFQIGAGGSFVSAQGSVSAVYIGTNAYYNGGWKYTQGTYQPSVYAQNSGEHRWYTAPSGTAGNTISFTQAMTLTSGGNLLVSTTTDYGYRFNTLVTSSATPQLVFIGTNLNQSFTAKVSTDGAHVGSGGGNFILDANGSERARITSGGYFKASNDGAYINSTGTTHEFNSNAADDLLVLRNSNASAPYGIDLNFSGAAPDNNTQYFFRCRDNASGSTTRCIIWSDGDLANHDGVYGTISDQKLKQDIVDAGSQWNDIKAIRFRKYRMKSDVSANPDAPALLGVIAQELEQVSPGLVDEHPDMETVEVTDEDGNVTQTQQPTGTTTKTVKSSILLMKAAVALQEAMARIEKLEAEVAALKGA